MAKQIPQKAEKNDTNAVNTVWQWVCYGLWELSLITLSVLMVGTLAYYFIDGSADYTFSIYLLAAMLCLLPPAFIVDRQYARREPAHKHGFAAVIMVLNGVLVFLATVAAFITAVMVSLAIIIDGDPEAGQTIIIISSLVVAVLGAMLFMRIINANRFARFAVLFRYVVAGVAALTLVAACTGPVRSLMQNRTDRLIESNLMMVQAAIDNYASDNNKLPASLDDVNLSQGQYDRARKLVERDLITYKANTQPTKTGEVADVHGSKPEFATGTNEFYYQLCATFQHKRGKSDNYDKYNNSSYLYNAEHPEGYHCYNLRSTTYGR